MAGFFLLTENWDFTFFVESGTVFGILALSLFTHSLDGRSCCKNNISKNNFMTPYNCHYKNYYLSDSSILHSVSSWRTTIARGKYRERPPYSRSTKLQKLLRYHSDADASEYCDFIEMTYFLTVQYLSRLYDSSDSNRKLDSHLHHSTY